MLRWMIRLSAIALFFAVTAAAAATSTTGPTTAATTQALPRPDPHLWTRRNLELLRAADTHNEELGASGAIDNVLMFSISFNLLFLRDPYAQEALTVIDAALADAAVSEATRRRLVATARFLRLPEDERILRQLTQQMKDKDLGRPVVRAGNELNLASALAGVLGLEPYEPMATQAIEQMDAAARKAGRWKGLALAYSQLADSALRRELRERADLYVDRMLAIVREYPEFQDPNRGNTQAMSPTGVASLLVRMGRQRDFDALLSVVDNPAKVELLIGMTAAQARDDRLDAARELVEKQLRPLAPAAADRLATALDGRVVPLPRPATTASTRAAARETDPSELRLREAASSIASAHARGPEPQEADDADDPAGAENLESHQWANRGYAAHRRGRHEAARRAFDRALDLLAKDRLHTPEQIEEKTRFVREALKAEDIELAHRMLNTSSQPGAYGYYRLAQAHRRRGDTARADAMTEEAIALAGEGRGGGSSMANIAVDLHAAGQVKRAEQLLAESIDHIEGVDFGLSGTAAIVKAATRMSRLDLLDRFYESYDPGEKMLLCIMAARAGFFPESAESEE